MGKIKFIIFIVVILIIVSCTKEERFSPGGLTQDQMYKGSGNLDFGNVFMAPLPTGGDDTPNLLAAIELAQGAGPGSVVQLQEGTYMIGFVEVRDFSGTIMGKGKGKTTIKPLSNLPCHVEVLKSACVSLISFIGGDVKLKDLSLKIDDGFPCAEDYTTTYTSRDLYVMVKFIDRFHDFYDPEVRFIKASVENVDFEAGIDGKEEGFPGHIWNLCEAIWFGHDFSFTAVAADETRSNGNMTVSNCTFREMWGAIDIAGVGGGKLIARNNRFLNIGSPLFYFDIINSEGVIADNIFENSRLYDIYINDMDYSSFGFYPYSEPVRRTIWKISGNYFNTWNHGDVFMHPAGVSMYLLDVRPTMYPEENIVMKFYVENNRINLHEEATGIVGMNNRDAMIVANKFSGTGATGISVSGTSADMMASGLKILGNNFMASDLETDVYLGEFTTNCLVTRNFKDNVVNLGVNNRITGMPK